MTNDTRLGLVFLQTILFLGLIVAFALVAYYMGMFDSFIREWQTIHYHFTEVLAVLQ